MKKNFCQKKLSTLWVLFFFHNFIYSITISVLLGKYNLQDNFTLHFDNIHKVSDLYDPDAFFLLNDLSENSDTDKNIKTECEITYKKGFWFLNGRKLKINNILLEKKDFYIDFQNFIYDGAISIQKDINHIYVVNRIDIESYVASVVAKEVYPVWDLDVLKIAAIIARTYALHKIKLAKNKQLFHIKDSIIDQQYSGHIFHEKINKAVSETNGKIIVYKLEPILAMYHVCCGGVIPTQCVGFDFKKFPYLKRKKQCLGCKDYKRYEWINNFDANEFCLRLSNFCNKIITKINKVKNILYAKSGTVRRLIIEVQIINKKNKKENIQLILTNKDLRKLFDMQLSSYSPFFKLYFDNNFNVEVSGKGNGHHMGVCQIGMNYYIKEGFSIEEIIKFYYPGTNIISIYELQKKELIL